MIQNLEEAVRFFRLKVLDNRGVITKRFDGTKGPIALRITVSNTEHYTVFYKKSWNKYFGKIWPRLGHEIGQSAKLRIVEESANNLDVIGTVHPFYEAYVCQAKAWLDYAREHGTIRIPSTETEQEASVPRAMLLQVVPNQGEQQIRGTNGLLSKTEGAIAGTGAGAGANNLEDWL